MLEMVGRYCLVVSDGYSNIDVLVDVFIGQDRLDGITS